MIYATIYPSIIQLFVGDGGLFQCPLKAWSESKVQSTKLNIIMSLSLYGEKGMEEFERLERECTDKDDSFLFKQVRVFDSYIKNLAR